MPWTMYSRDGQRKYLTKSERAAFLAATKGRTESVRTFCWIMAATGCRISEALALKGRNIDFEAGQVIIECLKKRGKQVFRAVPLPAELLKNLKALIETVQRSSDRLWPWSRMTGYRRIREIMEEAGIKGAQATPKGLRHGFGVCAIQSKVPLNLVQRWLGHADIKTTSIYTSAMGPEERQIASRMWCDGLADTGDDKKKSRKAKNQKKKHHAASAKAYCECCRPLRSGRLLAISDGINDPINLSEIIKIVPIGDGPVISSAEEHCHLIQFWLKCISQCYNSTSAFSGLTSGKPASPPPPWHNARDFP